MNTDLGVRRVSALRFLAKVLRKRHPECSECAELAELLEVLADEIAAKPSVARALRREKVVRWARYLGKDRGLAFPEIVRSVCSQFELSRSGAYKILNPR